MVMKTSQERFACALVAIEGQGKLPVIIQLLHVNSVRFSALGRALPSLPQRRLVRCLRELEAAGLVHRAVLRAVPPRVEYSLTPWGRGFDVVVDSLHRWSNSPARA